MAFNFRLANLDDAEEICPLVNATYRGESGARSWTGESHLLDGQRVDVAWLKEIISTPASVILVAETSSAAAASFRKQIVGCVQLRSEGSFAYLGMLTADVAHQRNGLGSALLLEAERYVSEVFRLREIRMSVISLRGELIEWYQRRGYKLSGEHEPFPYGNVRFGLPKRDDLEFVILTKKV